MSGSGASTSRTGVSRGRVVSLEAAARCWQVVIVGGGPAAAACGIAAVSRGLEVLLVERCRMPRAKLCGCCLSPRALAELSLLGLAAGQDGLGGIPLETVRLVTAARQVRLPMPGGVTLSRDRLDAALLGLAVQRGCHLLAETSVSAVDVEDRAARITCRPAAGGGDGDATHTMLGLVTTQAECELAADCVVLATGLSESVRVIHRPAAMPPEGLPRRGRNVRPVAAGSRLGLGTTLPPEAMELPAGELVMAIDQRGYCGVVRLEDGRIDVAAAVDPDLVADRGAAAAVAEILGHAGCETAALATARLRGTPLMTRSSPRADGRLFRTGDAANYVEPFTGEGIGWALASGRLLGESLAASLQDATIDVRAAAAVYERRHQAELGKAFRRCQLVARAVRSPPLISGLMAGMRLAPAVAAPLVRLATGARRTRVVRPQQVPR